ncbi:MAG: hypothetical protein LBF93_05935 [Zoogloeaceae bacterium]|jgi:hypothetical protein|nr:hypothetical protein [Zoogloeaceae bacterium]
MAWLLATALVMALVAAGLAMWARQRLAQVESGVCEEAGRALTKEELRRAVLQSLVDCRVNQINVFSGYNSGRIVVAGIVRNPEETNVFKLMEKAVQSDTRTFEENFGLEEIAPRKDRFDISSLQEPFMLAGYETSAQGTADFYVSTDVREANFNGQLSLYRMLLGYGKYYFYVPYTVFGKRCCDKSFPREKREYTYRSIAQAAIRRSKLPKEVVPVSNCGKLLTERENDTGFNFHQLVYLKEN